MRIENRRRNKLRASETSFPNEETRILKFYLGSECSESRQRIGSHHRLHWDSSNISDFQQLFFWVGQTDRRSVNAAYIAVMTGGVGQTDGRF